MKMNSDYKPRPIEDVIADVHKRVIEQNGRLYTEEEVVKMVEEAKRELQRKGEL